MGPNYTIELSDMQQRAFLKYLGKQKLEDRLGIQNFFVVSQTDETMTLAPGMGTFTWIDDNKNEFKITFREEGDPCTNERGGINYFHRLYIEHSNIYILQEFVKNALKIVKNTHSQKVNIHRAHNHGFWEDDFSIYAQSIDDVFLPSKIKTDIVKRIDDFNDAKDRYNRLGRTHKIGFLLTGIPGSGKTTLIKSLALKYDRDIFSLNFSKAYTDETIITLMTRITDNSILIIEDIDSYFQHRKAQDINVGFSCILNVLDGTFNKGCGLIIFLTCNNPDSLDRALIRPGRVDMIYEFEYPQKPEVKSAFDILIEMDDAEKKAALFEEFWKKTNVPGVKVPMCSVIDFLFRHYKDFNGNVDELVSHTRLLNTIENDKVSQLYT